MAKDKIPGIYNYCDRWCERCIFTSRCSVFEETTELPPEENDLKNKAFWDRLARNFAKAKEMLEQSAEKFGVDLDKVKENLEEAEREEEEIRRRSQNHNIVKMTREYSLFTHQWLQTQPGMMDKLEEIKEKLTVGAESHTAVKSQTEMIKDSLSVIQWYMTFIEPKLMRALMSKFEARKFYEEDDDPKDYDGSAKIALIAVDRSMHAWIDLFELLPDQEDQFLKPLSLLEKIKKETLMEFPDAMNFVRPGFDQAL